ncbi:MAG: ATP-binding protein [Phycisphaerae bacterium]
MAWKFPESEFTDLILAQNPWWSGQPVPVNPPFRRAMQRLLLREVRSPSIRRFELVVGPRRVGKTTLMSQIVADLLQSGVPARRIAWLRLDHPQLMSDKLGDLVALLIDSQPDEKRPNVADPLYVFLDEIAYANNWSGWLKTFYDDNWPVRIIASGSSTATLRQEHRESGVGRWREWFLSPLLLHDYLGISGVTTPAADGEPRQLSSWRNVRSNLAPDALHERLLEYLLIGGFPELALASTQPQSQRIFRAQEVLRDDAITRSLYKDLSHAYSIQNPMALEKLLYILAGSVGGVFAVESVAGSVGVSQPTIDSYIRYLEEAGLIFVLPNYATSEETVQRRGRKVFLADSALRNAALQRGSTPLRDPAELGILFENTVAVHLHAYCRARQIRLYHWRHGRLEVDFVVGHPSEPIAFEATGSQSHATRGLRALLKRYPAFQGRGWVLRPNALPHDPTNAGEPTLGEAPLAEWLLLCGIETDEAILRR